MNSRFIKIGAVLSCAVFLSFVSAPGYAHANIVVTTASSDPVSFTSETLNGSIINDTGIGVTQSGFVYGTYSDGLYPGIALNPWEVTVTALGPQTGTAASFSQTLTGLTPNTTYYFIAYVVDSTGTEFDGSVLSFTTNRIMATTDPASSIFPSIAILNGSSVSYDSYTQDTGFTYGTVPDLSTVIATVSSGPNNSIASFQHELIGLTPDTTYYFRAYAVDSTGTSTGSILSFTTATAYFEEAQDTPVLVKGGTYNGWEADAFAAPAATYDGTRYVMTVSMFSAAEDKWASGFFTSPDMKNWTYVNNSLFPPSVSDDILGNAGIAWFQGKYWFAYDYGQTALAIATSTDLLHWNTVVAPLVSYGADASLDINPVSGKLEVWYMTKNNPRHIHMQDSSNGTAWTDEGNYLSSGSVVYPADFGEPSVFYIGNVRYMTFDGGFGAGKRNTILTHSVNQDTNWVSDAMGLSNNPNNEWESQQVFDGSVLVADLGDGRGLVPRLLYAGSDNDSSTDNTDSSIGLAYPMAFPVVATVAPALVRSSSLTMNGLISDEGQGDIIQSGFTYGTDPTLNSVIATTTIGSHSGAFSQSMSGLTPNTTYYFRAYAVNLIGTSTGAILSATTLALAVPDAPAPTPVSAAVSYSQGGGSVSASRLATILAPGPATTAYLASLNHATVPGCPVGFTCTPNSASVTIPTAAIPGAAFTESLTMGNTNPEVKDLQVYLNAHGYVLASTGPGSPGHETDFFGSLTKKAVMRFQKDHALPVTGFFGSMTRRVVGKQ